MIDALLTEIGLRTGRYTSPHLQRATERINVDNRPISPERYVELYRDVAAVRRHGRREPRRAVEVRGAHRDGLRRVRRRAGRGGGDRGRARRAWDATNVADGDGRGDHPDRPRPRRVPGHRRAGHRPGEGRDHQAGRGGRASPSRTRRWPQVLLERCVEVDAQVARQGAEFGVESREIAIGGQRLALQGLSGTVRRHLPAAARRAPGGQRRAGAGRGRGADRRRAAAADRSRRRARRVRRRALARAGWSGSQPARASADGASSTPRTTRTAPARSRPRSPPSSASPGSSACSA